MKITRELLDRVGKPDQRPMRNARRLRDKDPHDRDIGPKAKTSLGRISGDRRTVYEQQTGTRKTEH